MAFDLQLDEDQIAIAELFESFFEKEVGPDRVRDAEQLGFDAKLWHSLCELGAAGMSSGSPDAGGVRFSDLVVALEALGRSAAPVPWVEHLAAATCDPAQDVLEGTRIVSLAVRPANRDGLFRLAPAGAVAHTIVGLDGDEFVAVTSEPPGVAPANHGSAPIADRSARDGDRRVLGGRTEFAEALDRWRLFTAAALVGIASKAQALALHYLNEREQFGRPIAAFQALQHGVADFPAQVEGAQMVVHKAAWAFDRSERGVVNVGDGKVQDPRVLTQMAFCFARDAAALTTDRSLHYHGSYGFSQEYEIQLYYRRARAWPSLLESPAEGRARLADLLWPIAGE